MRLQPAAGALLALALATAACTDRSAPGASTVRGAGGDGAGPARYGFGRPVTADELRRWDIDVRPDGTGLPAGSGTVGRGKGVYARQCASCHGSTGTEGPFDRLAGREPRAGFPFGREPTLVSTIGNYWPYATTLYDYINRAMPFNAPGSLAADDIYAVVAYLLYLNELLPETTVLNAETLPRVVMPARDRFVVDNRRGGAEIR